MANGPQANELFFRPPIHWDPVPDWWLERINPRLQREIIGLRFEISREILEIQMKGLDRAQKLVQQGLGDTEDE